MKNNKRYLIYNNWNTYESFVKATATYEEIPETVQHVLNAFDIVAFKGVQLDNGLYDLFFYCREFLGETENEEDDDCIRITEWFLYPRREFLGETENEEEE